jgi:hypothetical protein
MKPPNPTSASQNRPPASTLSDAWVGRRSRSVRRLTDPDAGEEPFHREADRDERPAQKALMLEAVAATPLGEQFSIDRFRTQIDAAPEHHVDRLERDRRHVPLDQSRQHVRRRPERAGIADTLQVG